jgi:glycosyltransferase involved in cell wall biosynthesis
MREARKIALITGGLPFGGTTAFALNLASGLRSLNVSTAVFSLSRENRLAEEFANAQIPVYTTDERRTIFEDRLMELYRKISEYQPDAVIANIGADAYEVLRYVPAGVTRVGVVHDLAMRPDILIPAYQENLDGVAVVNRHLVKDVLKAGPAVVCQYLAHGIPIATHLPSRSPNPGQPLKIIFFGRLEPGKGTRLFPRIVAALNKRGIPFQWTIHGEGSEETFLRERLADEITAGHVVLSAKLPREEVFSLVRRHDVFLMASQLEGGPLTLLEAMSLGLVPIGNDIPCLVQEVIREENGFRVSAHPDPQEYADAIATLHNDRDRLERMSAVARETITSQYSIEAMARRYLDFIASVSKVPSDDAWPAQIHPQPIRCSSALSRLTQKFGPIRQARRILKKIQTRHL